MANISTAFVGPSPGKQEASDDRAVRTKSFLFYAVNGLANVVKYKLVSARLVDIRHIPVEYGAVFFHQAPDVTFEMVALRLKFLLLDSWHAVCISLHLNPMFIS